MIIEEGTQANILDEQVNLDTGPLSVHQTDDGFVAHMKGFETMGSVVFMSDGSLEIRRPAHLGDPVVEAIYQSMGSVYEQLAIERPGPNSALSALHKAFAEIEADRAPKHLDYSWPYPGDAVLIVGKGASRDKRPYDTRISIGVVSGLENVDNYSPRSSFRVHYFFPGFIVGYAHFTPDSDYIRSVGFADSAPVVSLIKGDTRAWNKHVYLLNDREYEAIANELDFFAEQNQDPRIF